MRHLKPSPLQAEGPANASRGRFLLAVFAGVALSVASCKGAAQNERAQNENAQSQREQSENTLAEKSAGTSDPVAQSPRVVSLSPGVTETIVALGHADDLVGLSDYCIFQAGDRAEPPRLGSAITPNYEAIARVEPTLILASQVAGDQLKPLSQLAPTHSLPWLTLNELTDSIEVLGGLIHAEPQAQALAKKIHTELSALPPEGAPRILLALDYGDSGTNDTWFIRQNSIHGAVLHAAGAKNAVSENVVGQPKLSPEQLIAVDPDAIIVLRSSAPDPASETRNLTHFRKWTPLRAVKENRIRVLSLEGSLAVGPGVLSVTSKLKQVIGELMDPGRVGPERVSPEGPRLERRVAE